MKVKEIMLFAKRHVGVLILLFVSFIVLLKWTSIPMWSIIPGYIGEILVRPVKGTTSFELLEIFCNLSLAYMASLIFYMVVDYVPSRKKEVNAFKSLKSNLESIYAEMSYIIRMLMYDIQVEKPVSKIERKDIERINTINVENRYKYVDITHTKNGERGNVKSDQYNLYIDLKEKSENIYKKIDYIMSLPVSSSLDAEIIETLSKVRNSRFLHIFNYAEGEFFKHVPGYTDVILNLDDFFIEFRDLWIDLGDSEIDKPDYIFLKMTEEEISKAQEEKYFFAGRGAFLKLPKEKVVGVLKHEKEIDLNADTAPKFNAVLLEMLVAYDYDKEKCAYLLGYAKDLSERLCKYEGSKEYNQMAKLNEFQILVRMNMVSQKDIKELNSILEKPADKMIDLGKQILLKNKEKAATIFEELSDKEKEIFIQFPIYRLWEHPPMTPNMEPELFTIFE